ncbi:MAG TPA: copper resistance CopC family protein [Blastococcus sp.]|nr:copper resistance CopC family protein [Blastococcus sp.]
MPVTRRMTVVLLTALLAWLATPSTAQAHERLTASEPAADAVLPAVPPRVLLTFSGNVVDPAPTLELLDAAGAEVRGGEPVVEGATVALPLPDGLPNGSYTVQWRIVSSDGDPVSGDYAFTVAAPVTAAPPPSPSASSSETSAAPSSTFAGPVGVVDGGDPSVGPWLVAGAAAAALLVAVLVVRRSRSRG